ncbi:alpha/beta hydrolase family protein [Salisediminibacterium halotolerans]|uniref:alpha/beta hydrolase family protein n=1 Tax=Salisediminibacterium halotolerans TaxID=517425 RepID=UPI000EAF8924|nr:prolyl oligopeptidase family serine peptidase [Salisediminibacterium halotolerans]RLJ80874.1 prolyl oligopeptidase family protein [Actinophytocola xinjiangensis]RPE83940.1 prolyl oligopeptidase family protein [Salisediminibacterium halotolerans]TWG37818.1 prolyl oligopeptidase family protein [Salisediminibacterium halotolerans]GEL09055.1 putative peptidase YtmA [Salisediminibacterium halotolerans]
MTRVMRSEQLVSSSARFLLHEITYRSGDCRVKGLLVTPQHKNCGEGILYLRGGIKHIGMVRIPRLTQFANEGFTVFAPYYRGNEGGEGEEDFGGRDREDAFSGFDVLQEYLTGEATIHIVGFSRGGIMAGLTAVNRVSASVTFWGGVADCFLMYQERPDLRKMLRRTFSGPPEQSAEIYKERSPLYFAERISCPIFIIHGTHDKHVSFRHAAELNEALLKLDKDVSFRALYGQSHRMKASDQLAETKRLCRQLKQ